MSKAEKEQRAREFWAHYAPTQGRLSEETLAWLREDDCLSPQYATRMAAY